jgi:hypothetical protein
MQIDTFSVTGMVEIPLSLGIGPLANEILHILHLLPPVPINFMYDYCLSGIGCFASCCCFGIVAIPSVSQPRCFFHVSGCKFTDGCCVLIKTK